MVFRGARFAYMEETPEARRLDVTRLKRIVGCGRITARLIGKDVVEFPETHTLFISTNYRPVVDETDHGTWRRLKRVTFPYTYRTPGEPLTSPQDKPGEPGEKGYPQDWLDTVEKNRPGQFKLPEKKNDKPESKLVD